MSKTVARIASLIVVATLLLAPATAAWAQDPTPTPETPTDSRMVGVALTTLSLCLGLKAQFDISGVGFSGGVIPLTVTITDANTGGVITTIPVNAIADASGDFTNEITWPVPFTLYNSNTYRVRVQVMDSNGKQLNSSAEVFDIDFKGCADVLMSGPDYVQPGDVAHWEIDLNPKGVQYRLYMKFYKPDGTNIGEVAMDVPVADLLVVQTVNWNVPPDLSDKSINYTITDDLGRIWAVGQVGVNQPDLTGNNPEGTLTVDPTRVQNDQQTTLTFSGSYFKPNVPVYVRVQSDQDYEYIAIGRTDSSGNISTSVTWTPQGFLPGRYNLGVFWKDQEYEAVEFQGTTDITIALSEEAVALRAGVADALRDNPDLVSQIAKQVPIPEEVMTQDELDAAIKAALNDFRATLPTPAPAPAATPAAEVSPYSPAADPNFKTAVNEAIDPNSPAFQTAVQAEVERQLAAMPKDRWLINRSWMGAIALILHLLELIALGAVYLFYRPRSQ